MSYRLTKRLLFLLFTLVSINGCVLFEEVEYKEADYWSNGECKGYASTVYPEMVSTDCRGISLSGCCDADGNALYCYENKLYCKSCKYDPTQWGVNAGTAKCSWSTEEDAYWCTATDNGFDPSGQIGRACPALDR
ncbi:MAG: hypothetical protein JXR76_16415 [Deltaproteobacteria bacterium]|nr:hypothetical protein [Deltaproteobacteria bacterium]